MILFFISLILTVSTAFFITSLFEQKNFIKIFLYFVMITGANIVGSVEVLSLFSAISPLGILLLNVFSTLVSGYIWFKKGHPGFQIDFKPFFKRLWYTLRNDKYLLVLGASFLFMCAVLLSLIAIMPVVSVDGAAYHVLRSTFWITDKNLSHFTIGDIRNIVMPINSEILYLWVILFTKKMVWLGMFSFIGFLMSIFSLYGILTNMKFTLSRKIWTLLILSSLPSVIILSSGTETDMIISGLVLANIYLYWEFVRSKNDCASGYFSALAYALAIGTKTTSFFFFPVLFIFWLAGAWYYHKKDFYSPLLKLFGFGVLNFVLFASYNYILNFIDFGNPLGSAGFTLSHKNLHGIKGTFSYFIKHIFMFFDFSGFTWNETFGKSVIAVRDGIINVLGLRGIPDGLNSGDSQVTNRTLMDALVGMGILGFLLYLPCLLFALVKPVFRRNKQSWFVFACASGLILTVFFMSSQLVYMTFSIRFLTSICVVFAPILTISYCKKNNFFKFIVTFFALFGFLLISTHIWARPFGRVITHLKGGASIREIRQNSKCSMLTRTYPSKIKFYAASDCILDGQLRTFSTKNKILYFPNTGEELLKIKLTAYSEGYDIDFETLENLKNIDFDKYNLIILVNNQQGLNYFKQPYIGSYYSAVPGSFCRYLSKTVNKKIIPGYALCELTPEFYASHNLKEIRSTDFKNRELSSYRFIFYENLNNPIVKD